MVIRVCGLEGLKFIHSFGKLYTSTFITKKGENIGKYPLELMLCKPCDFLQLRHTTPQEIMYSRKYWYKSGLNKVIVNDLKDIVKQAQKLVKFKKGDIWLDIGANDGTLLKGVPKKYFKVGVEPAKNLTRELVEHCDLTICEFWSYPFYVDALEIKAKRGFKTKVVTAIGMFYDMDNPNQFIKDVAMVLDDDGIFVAQCMCLNQMIRTNDIGNICHEHLEYYSYKSLVILFERNGLEIFKVEENTINGGSYRLYARHYKKGSIKIKESKVNYEKFIKNIQRNKVQTKKFIELQVRKGKVVYGYGASTKGNTTLQYYKLDSSLIKGIADINPEKIGKMTVGTEIPIVSEKEARENADYFLVLPYAFRKSFIKREKSWLKKGGKFIFSTPTFKII